MLQVIALLTVDTDRTFAHIKVFTLIAGIVILVNCEKGMKIVGLSFKDIKKINFRIKKFFFQKKKRGRGMNPQRGHQNVTHFSLIVKLANKCEQGLGEKIR